MPTLKITAKGQVTLKKEALAHLGVGPGDTIDVDMAPGGRLELRAARRTGKIADVFGIFKNPDGPHLTLEEISEVIRHGWAGEL